MFVVLVFHSFIVLGTHHSFRVTPSFSWPSPFFILMKITLHNTDTISFPLCICRLLRNNQQIFSEKYSSRVCQLRYKEWERLFNWKRPSHLRVCESSISSNFISLSHLLKTSLSPRVIFLSPFGDI